MQTPFERFQNRRLISSYFSVVVSISLVLFLLGALGLLVLNTKAISDRFKEQVVLSVYFNDTAKDADIAQLEKAFKLSPEVKSVKFISKEDAASMMQQEYGADFLDDVGYNPLEDVVDINLKADFVTEQFLDSLSQLQLQKPFISEVRYDQDLVHLMTSNVKRISFWILVVCAVFSVIAVLLLNTSIRLAINSKRFIIISMQMVVPTETFIRKPFIFQSLKLGLLGSTLAVVGLATALYNLEKYLPELNLFEEPIHLLLVGVGIVVFGVGISWVSTFFATQRFLKLRSDQLY